MIGNPVCDDPSFCYVIGALFTNLTELNGNAINLNHFSSRGTFKHWSILKTTRILIMARMHAEIFTEESDIDETFENFKSWSRFAVEKEISVSVHLGKYFSPYLKYINNGSTDDSLDASSNIAMQESRLFWLSDTASEMHRECGAIPLPSMDDSLHQFMYALKKRIELNQIVFLQNLWRSRVKKLKYQNILRSCSSIKKTWRSYRACKSAKRRRLLLADVKRRRDSAAIQIQRIFKGR